MHAFNDGEYICKDESTKELFRNQLLTVLVLSARFRLSIFYNGTLTVTSNK